MWWVWVASCNHSVAFCRSVIKKKKKIFFFSCTDSCLGHHDDLAIKCPLRHYKPKQKHLGEWSNYLGLALFCTVQQNIKNTCSKSSLHRFVSRVSLSFTTEFIGKDFEARRIQTSSDSMASFSVLSSQARQQGQFCGQGWWFVLLKCFLPSSNGICAYCLFWNCLLEEHTKENWKG